MKKFLRFEFLPTSTDLALLVLRVWLGGSMVALHGWGKLLGLVTGTSKFPDILGIGQTPALALAVFAEAVCSVLIMLGLWTRFAAVFLIATMGVAFVVAHEMNLKGPGSGELAYIYLAGFVTLLLAGGGKFSVDRK